MDETAMLARAQEIFAHFRRLIMEHMDETTAFGTESGTSMVLLDLDHNLHGWMIKPIDFENPGYADIDPSSGLSVYIAEKAGGEWHQDPVLFALHVTGERSIITTFQRGDWEDRLLRLS